MLSRILFASLCIGSFGACASLRCRWLDHRKFSQYSEESLNLLDIMANSTNKTEEHHVHFPEHLYKQASRASDEGKIAFTVQILKETSALMEKAYDSSSLDKITLEKFLSVVNRQTDELHSCIVGRTQSRRIAKLHTYFRRLSREILNKMEHSAEAWQLIRGEIRHHLMRADNLLTSKV